MNFGYLATKYLKADVIVHDRTYEGLEWRGPGAKPGRALFESLQEQENQGSRAKDFVAQGEAQQMVEVQAQARAAAERASIPFKEKLMERFEEVKAECIKVTLAAEECRLMLKARSEVENSWREITELQDQINQTNQKYLEETAHFLSWDSDKVPKGVIEMRVKAHSRIDFGKTVYADWSSLRSAEMPSREELIRALQKGGDHLKEMRAICKEVALRYPKPKKSHF
jgi:hypothetical protein